MRDSTAQASALRPPGQAARRAGDGKSVRPALFYLLFGLLCSTNVVAVVGFLMSPDIARLVSGQNEHGALGLRGPHRPAARRGRPAPFASIRPGRQHQPPAPRACAATGSPAEQHQYVKLLAQKASELGIETNADRPDPGEPRVGSSSSTRPDARCRRHRGGQRPGPRDDGRDPPGAHRHRRRRDRIRPTRSSPSSASVGIRPDLPEDAVGGPFIDAGRRWPTTSASSTTPTP